MPTTNELTAHVADKETLLINCHLHLKKGNREGSTFFKSSMSAISPRILKALPVSSNLPAPSCVNSQANSTPVLLACADQRARQRNMGIAKKSCHGFRPQFSKGRLFGRPPVQTNPELSTLCIYPKQLLNNTKKVSINKTASITTLAQHFILQLRRNIPLTTMTSIVLCFGKRALETNASTFIQDLERDVILKGIFLSNF